jgi:hypothetical protein
MDVLRFGSYAIAAWSLWDLSKFTLPFERQYYTTKEKRSYVGSFTAKSAAAIGLFLF